MIKYGLDWIDKNWRPEAFINNFRGPVGPCRGGGEGICKKLFFCFVFVFCCFFLVTTSTNIILFREKYQVYA